MILLKKLKMPLTIKIISCKNHFLLLHYIGAVWVFRLTNGVWTQYGSKLVPTGYTGEPGFSYETSSVAISGDSTTIAIGGPINDSDIGATWVYVGQ